VPRAGARPGGSAVDVARRAPLTGLCADAEAGLLSTCASSRQLRLRIRVTGLHLQAGGPRWLAKQASGLTLIAKKR